MNRLTKLVLAGLAGIMMASWGLPAAAQAYPAKPIRIIVPFPAGGVADIYARHIGNHLTSQWGQQVIVENRAGGGGNIGADAVAKAAPDGYTLLLSAIGPQAVNVALFSKMPYDAVNDFAPIALVLEAESLLAVHPSLPVKNVAELVALARAKPGALSYASAGAGTTSHLAAELLKAQARLDIVHIPYKGNVPAITDLLAGQVPMIFATMPTVLPHVKAGKLRGIATVGDGRSAATPDIPTVAESGYPGFEVTNWIGLLAPARTPPEIVNRLNAEVNKYMQQPDVKARLVTEGARFKLTTPEQFGAYIRNEIAKWTPIIKASGAKVD